MGMDRRAFLFAMLAACARVPGSLAGGTKVGTISFVREPPVQFGVRTGEGLLERLFADLGALDLEAPMIPPEAFFVRTGAPPGLPTGPWTLRLRGRVEQPVDVPLADLLPEAVDQGEVCMECSGNAVDSAYALLSSTTWRGVPLVSVLRRAKRSAGASRILVSGVDHRADQAPSVAGASWIFTPKQLEHAFLATEMGGAPLTVAHGAPVRLIVPGWYGCASIKWVDELRWVPDDAPSTPHMREFASRTHQRKTPQLARDFRAATTFVTAMPVRVERWEVDGQPILRIVGVLWGGTRTIERLQLRIDDGEPQDVELGPGAPPGWRTWTALWAPTGLERERTVVMSVPDPRVRTRRLRQGRYQRVFVA
jgi:DMSO/TMAO reductase YedYZ molybdopterin-dependent catalytic subunit